MKEYRDIQKDSSKGSDEIVLFPDSDNTLYRWKGFIKGYVNRSRTFQHVSSWHLQA